MHTHAQDAFAESFLVTLLLLVQEGTADTDKYDEQFDEEGERKQ